MFKHIVNQYKNKEVLIKGHDNPDVDSIVSCLLMSDLLEKLKVRNNILITGSIDYTTSRVLSELNIAQDRFIYENDESLPIILLDHSDTSLSNQVICCIDHHPVSKIYNYPVYKNIKSASCAKLVLDYYAEFNIKPRTVDIYRTVIASCIDTKNFTSYSKYTKEDAAWVSACVNRYKFNSKKIHDSIRVFKQRYR